MEKLEGMISDIVFKNEENGYTIAYLANEDEEVTIVGCMPTLSVGESIEVEGRWVTHKTYGSQFEVNKFIFGGNLRLFIFWYDSWYRRENGN